MIYSTVDVIREFIKTFGDPASDVCQFDNRRYHLSVYLVNPDGNVVKINKGAIEELVINDDVVDWFHSGTLIFTNPGDVLEKINVPTENSEPSAVYSFRGDARDMLYIQMSPEVGDSTSTGSSEVVENRIYTLKFLFSVYATEDILDSRGPKHKKQKLFFHDYRLQMLREKNMYYSTGKFNNTGNETVNDSISFAHALDKERSKPTGEIIQDILAGALPRNDIEGKFSRYWDFGSQKLLYTSPSEYKALDDIEYMMDRHVSTGSNEPCILKLERYTDRWELLPVSEYFNRAIDRSTSETGPGVYQSENFILAGEDSAGDEQAEKEVPTLAKFFGVDKSTPLRNYQLPEASTINDYVFSEINGIDCQEILNSVIVHRYDESSKTFGVDVSDGNIGSVKSNFQSLYIDNMYGDGKGYRGATTNWLTDTTRASNLNISIESSWSPNKISSLSVGRNKKLLGAFMLGNTIQFDVPGATPRRSGVWISVDRSAKYTDNDYDRKVLGQYFVTRVTHTITNNEYTTNIIAVKPYSYGKKISTQVETTNATKDMFGTNPEEFHY